MISPKNKLLLKRFLARQLRRLVDFSDDSLHEWEMSLRTISLPTSIRSAAKREPGCVEGAQPARVSFIEWEARRPGIALAPKPRRRAHRGAADFDRELRERFSR